MGKVIGIDLGTTNSCVAVMEGDKPKVIENSEGDRTTPSIVAFSKDGEVLVGQSAKRQAVTNPHNTLYAVKRLIGRRFEDDVVQRDIDMVPYSIVKADNGDAWVKANDKEMAPPEVSARVLQKMKKTAEDYLGESVTEAVVTVPAYFNDSQRQATKDAGRIAGLDVKRIINEPTAAALAYGMDKKRGDAKIVVYDLGGGTFDVSIIEIAEVDGEHQFEVLATNGDTFLGGEDFDMRIMEYLTSEFERESGVDISKDPLAMQRLKESAEKAKIELSTSQQTEVNLPYITADASGPKHLNIKLTRAKLESLVEELVARTIGPCKIALKDADLKVNEIDDVILVGGQTRMPKVQEEVQNLFGKEPRRDVNPDEAVALGASIQGGVLAGDVKRCIASRRDPVVTRNRDDGSGHDQAHRKEHDDPGERRSDVSPRLMTIRRRLRFMCCRVSERRAADNKSLGRFDLSDIPPAPRGMPQIEVQFDIDANGILNVSAKDKATGKSQNIVIKASSGLSDDEIETMVSDAAAHEEEDRKFRELVDARNQADGLIHASEKTLSELGDKATGEDRHAIETAVADLKAVLEDGDKETIDTKTAALAEASAAVAQKLYAEQGGAEGAEAPEAEQSGGDDVVDAEFEEVDDEDKSKSA